MEGKVFFPIMEGKIAERGIKKKEIAEALNITQRTLANKLAGKTEFTWSEVVTLQAGFFSDVPKETLMTMAASKPA